MFKIKHCIEFEAIDIWYLENINEFTKRSLALGRCPKCKKEVAVLRETHKQTGKEYVNVFSAQKAIDVIKNERNRVTYTALELQNKDKSTIGFKFGVNKERKNKKNKVTSINQYACDFYNNRHLVRKLKV